MAPHWRKDLFLSILEEVRVRYDFSVFGYVVMPEHIHLLLGEPQRHSLSTAMQVLKQRVSRCVHLSSSEPPAPDRPHFWLPRSYDFNVFTRRKFVEKLRYIHRNPVKRGLVETPEEWRWSSYRFYAFGEDGPVHIGHRAAEMVLRFRES